MAAALTLHFARYSSSRDMRLEPGFLLVIDFKHLRSSWISPTCIMYMRVIDRIDFVLFRRDVFVDIVET